MKTGFTLAIVIITGICALRCQTTPDEESPLPVPPPSEPPKFATNELEKLAMPIALHPDPLIAIVLPAAVYPVEIVQAARFVKDTNNIPKVDDQSWDENVKAVAHFPELITKMSDDLAWTVDLGHAFLDQSKELMDTIQLLRAKAHNAQTLQTSTQQIVIVTNYITFVTNTTTIVQVTNQIIEIQPANPKIVYVPVYPPTVYYPPPHYVYNPYAPLIAFGIGVAWGAVWANNCYWRGGHVHVKSHSSANININKNVNKNINRNTGSNRPGPPDRGGDGSRPWRPDQGRLRNNGGGSATTREARGWGSGTTQPSTGNAGSRPSTGAVGNRPSTGAVGDRPSTGAIGNRPSTGAAGNRPTTGAVGDRPSAGAGGSRPSTGAGANRPAGGGTPSVNQPQTRPSPGQTGSGTARPAQGGGQSGSQRPSGGALGDMNNGANARDNGNRGATSRGNTGGGSGSRRGASR